MLLVGDRQRPGQQPPRPVLEPNWRVASWVAGAGLLAFAGVSADGLVAFLLLCATVYAACQAAVRLVDHASGLNEWRQ